MCLGREYSGLLSGGMLTSHVISHRHFRDPRLTLYGYPGALLILETLREHGENKAQVLPLWVCPPASTRHTAGICYVRFLPNYLTNFSSFQIAANAAH